MHILTDNVRGALYSLSSNWLRTVLTMLGILIGVGSVALLVSIGLGVQKEVTEQVQGLGANLVFILPGKLEKNSQPNALALLGVSTLTDRDLKEVATLPSVSRVAPFLFVGGTAEYKGEAKSAFVLATTSSWFDIRPRPMAEGRAFTAAEEDDPVCVLGQAQREAIFGKGPAVGETLTVQGTPFQVVGVVKEEASGLFGDGGFENMIFLPAKAAEKHIPRMQINRIILQTNPASSPEQVLDEISRTLLKAHDGREDFAVLTQKQVLGTLYRLMAIVTALLSGISAISLIVAGIGIMNIMLVTVTERTFEIGIRRAVGARRRDIFVHFLSEAMIISLLGGVAGLVVAAGMGLLAEHYSPLHPLVTPGVIAMAFGVCAALGLVFGTAPALRAARLHPAEALRHE